MSRSLTSLAFLPLALFSACSKGKDAPAPRVVLEFGFEDSCRPTAGADLTVQVPPSGIAFGTGIEGRAASFDGSGAELKARGLDALGITKDMTLEFFVNVADWKNPYGAGSGLESMISHSDIFTVAVDPQSWKLDARLTTTAESKALRLGGGSMPPGGWHHVALVLDSAFGNARLVLDGEVVDEVSAQGDVPVRSDLDLVVGTWFQKNQAFCGALDSIRLWNKALSLDELRARAALIVHAPTSNS